MITGKFYYIKDEYYEKFPHCGLMGNKDDDEYGKPGRSCFYCIYFPNPSILFLSPQPKGTLE